MAQPTGAICHTELFASDLEESSRFYDELFGWTTSVLDEGYLLWKDSGGNSGGFTTAGAPITNPAATFYIKTTNIPEMLEKIKANGGIIIRPKTEIGADHGFYALFRDPAGNNIGLWSSK